MASWSSLKGDKENRRVNWKGIHSFYLRKGEMIMAKWTIKPLVYGTIEVKKDQLTTGLDVGLPLTVHYLGFYEKCA